MAVPWSVWNEPCWYEPSIYLKHEHVFLGTRMKQLVFPSLSLPYPSSPLLLLLLPSLSKLAHQVKALWLGVCPSAELNPAQAHARSRSSCRSRSSTTGFPREVEKRGMVKDYNRVPTHGSLVSWSVPQHVRCLLTINSSI